MDEARTGKRFPVHLPVRMADGTQAVASPVGTTSNISAAGVYVVLDRGFEIGSTVTFEMTVPKDSIGAEQDMTIMCKARVVRNDEQGVKTGIACVIDSYEFVRPGQERGA